MLETAVRQRTVEQRVHMAAARKVVVRDGHIANALEQNGVRLGRLQQMVALEHKMPNVVGVGEVERFDRVDFVVEELHGAHVRHAVKGVGANHPEVGLLQRQQRHIRQAAERVWRQFLQIHVGQLQQSDAVHAVEGIGVDATDARWQQQVLDVGETGEGFRLQLEHRIVGQQDELNVGGAGKGVCFDAQDFVVAEQKRGEILQAGKGEPGNGGERRVLDGDLAQFGQSAKGERLDGGDVVAVERKFLEEAQTGERIAFDDGKVVFGEREVFDGERQPFSGDLL